MKHEVMGLTQRATRLRAPATPEFLVRKMMLKCSLDILFMNTDTGGGRKHISSQSLLVATSKGRVGEGLGPGP